ncbi:SRPBCC family protein [Sphingorhabdus sp. Alg231-15]|uniref:SRPBCC family protein n=1 Tax=Sphingorhabdus sp. Alg231-15 TaxID=1922222 RepID=UPI000D557B2E
MATNKFSRFVEEEGKDSETVLMSDEDIIDRLFDHIDNGTTDRGQSSWKEPTANYLSAERLDREIAVLRRRWTVFYPSSALPKSGDYIARDAAGIPLIVVRGNDGEVRAFRNACRHRGVQVAKGQGCTSVFVCPYHGWSYGTDGTLRSVPHGDGFPGLEKEGRGLVSLDCVEKKGLVFVRQDTDQKEDKGLLDIPDLIPDGFRVVKSAAMEIEANWKLHLESALEGYHIRSTHQTTFFPVQYDNLTVVESFGENSRIAFPYQAIEGLRDKPRSKWSTNGRITFVYHLFPNVIISTFPDCMQVVIIEPLGLELTRQHMFLLTDCAEGGEALDAVFKGQEFAAKGAIEDRDVVMSAQRGLKSGANAFLEFGLFESAIGKFHETLKPELEDPAS